MANSRMYLANKRTGHRVLLAKFFPSAGWNLCPEIRHLPTTLQAADFSESDQQLNAAAIARTGNPFDVVVFAASSAIDGEEWEIQYG